MVLILLMVCCAWLFRNKWITREDEICDQSWDPSWMLNAQAQSAVADCIFSLVSLALRSGRSFGIFVVSRDHKKKRRENSLKVSFNDNQMNNKGGGDVRCFFSK